MNAHLEPPSCAELLAWIEGFIASASGRAPQTLHSDDSFHSLGVDSVMAMELVHSLGEAFKVEIDPTLIYDCRTVGGFTECVQQLGHAHKP
ncbi:MAG: acyl carrier protein [Ramlibacter sp.]|nr:acyl carrier protein [Ramlibacter sp.]